MVSLDFFIPCSFLFALLYMSNDVDQSLLDYSTRRGNTDNDATNDAEEVL